MQRWDHDHDPTRCLTCGSHVTPEFRRGFGDQRDRVHRCTTCDLRGRLALGTAAGQTVDEVDPLTDPTRFEGSFDDLPASVQALCRQVATDGGEVR